MISSPNSSGQSLWLGLIDQVDSLIQANQSPHMADEPFTDCFSGQLEQLRAEADCLASQQLDWIHRRVQLGLSHLNQNLGERVHGLVAEALQLQGDQEPPQDPELAKRVREAVMERMEQELKDGLERWKQDPKVTGKKDQAATRILVTYKKGRPFLSLASLQLSSLPPEIGLLWALTSLNLDGNSLERLPPEIGRLKRLKKLSIKGSKLQSLPNELGELKALESLAVSENQLQNFPVEVSKLGALKELYISDNQIKTLPASIQNLGALVALYAPNNKLETLPPEIGNLENLQWLVLRENKIRALPPEIGKLKALISLTLAENKLEALPAEIGGLEALSWLELKDNRLQLLPPEIQNLKALGRLYLSRNKLQSLPRGFGNLKGLRELDLEGNQVQALRPEFGGLRALKKLDLTGNRLKSLPPQFGDLEALEWVSLKNNLLGSLPQEFVRLDTLGTVDLSENQLQALPSSLEGLGSLQTLGLAANQLEALPPSIGDLCHLSSLNFQNNPTLNTLPLNLGNLAQITDLCIHKTGVSEEEKDAILAVCKSKRDNLAAEDLPRLLELWKRMARFKKGKEEDLDFILDFPDRSPDELSQCTIYDWLVRLAKAKDFRSAQRPLARKVCKILASLNTNKNFKSAFFAQVSANLENCEDRAAMALNEVYTSWKIETLANDTVDSPIRTKMQLLVGLAKTFALRKELAERVARQSAGMGESVEIFLYYETRLREPLGLVTAIKGMTHSDIGKRKCLPIKEIQAAVEARYLDELLELPAFIELADQQNLLSQAVRQPPAEDFDAYAEMEKLEALYELGELSSSSFQEAAKALMQKQHTKGVNVELKAARRD